MLRYIVYVVGHFQLGPKSELILTTRILLATMCHLQLNIPQGPLNVRSEIIRNCVLAPVLHVRRVSHITYCRQTSSGQYNCWSLRCSWSIACRCCSNYVLILDLTPGFNGLGKDNCKTRLEVLVFGVTYIRCFAVTIVLRWHFRDPAYA